MRALYLRMPAVATLVLVVGAGYIIGGIRSALVAGGLALFIALSPVSYTHLTLPTILLV